MFETYEERFPFESDYLNGNEPKAQVERLEAGPNAPCRFHATPDGLRRFAEQAEKFRIHELHINLTGQSGPIAFDAFQRPQDIIRLTILRSVDLGETYSATDVVGLEKLTGLTGLTVNLFPVMPEWFSPKVNFSSLSGDYASLKSLLSDPRVTELSRLDVVNFVGDIADFPTFETLEWYRLRGAKLGSMDQIADKFPKLQTLIIEAGRKVLNVGPLADLNMLTALKVTGPSRLESLDSLKLPAVQYCYLSQAQGAEFFDLNPQLTWFRVQKFTGEASKRMESDGWDKIGREHGTGDGYIPEVLRG